jgi:hypothetical protein
MNHQIETSIRAYDRALLTWRRDQTAFGRGFWYLIAVLPHPDGPVNG